MTNTDETGIDFTETRVVGVFGGTAIRRLVRCVTKVQDKCIPCILVITTADIVEASLLVITHSSRTQARQAVEAEAHELQAAVEASETDDGNEHRANYFEACLLSAPSDGAALEPSISHGSLTTDRAMRAMVGLKHQLHMATSAAWSTTGTNARPGKQVGTVVQEAHDRLAAESDESGDAAGSAWTTRTVRPMNTTATMCPVMTLVAEINRSLVLSLDILQLLNC